MLDLVMYILLVIALVSALVPTYSIEVLGG